MQTLSNGGKRIEVRILITKKWNIEMKFTFKIKGDDDNEIFQEQSIRKYGKESSIENLQ